MNDSGVLVVNRWKRYGKDRLYVETTAGARVGWWDLVTDEPHPVEAEHLEALTAAVASWKAGKSEHTPTIAALTPGR